MNIFAVVGCFKRLERILEGGSSGLVINLSTAGTGRITIWIVRPLNFRE